MLVPRAVESASKEARDFRNECNVSGGLCSITCSVLCELCMNELHQRLYI